jgi:hypothetical protein
MRVTTLLLFTFLLSPLFAVSVSATYDISFSVIGKIGEAEVFMEHNGTDYHIHAEGRLVGFAATVGKNRREVHDSYGKVVEGVFMPHRYVILRESDGFYEETEFLIDDTKHEVTRKRFRERTIAKSFFDIRTMTMKRNPEIERKKSTKTLSYFAADDVLSLFFNVRHTLKSLPEGSKFVGHTVGTTNKDGSVLVTNPGGERRAEIKKELGGGERLITVVIDQDIFESDKGELMLRLDEDYLAEAAQLNDVLLFGDVHAAITSKQGTMR